MKESSRCLYNSNFNEFIREDTIAKKQLQGLT